MCRPPDGLSPSNLSVHVDNGEGGETPRYPLLLRNQKSELVIFFDWKEKLAGRSHRSPFSPLDVGRLEPRWGTYGRFIPMDGRPALQPFGDSYPRKK